MNAEDIEAHCLALPGAHLVIQWQNAKVFKVADKVFAILTAEGNRVTLKCESTDTAEMLIAVGVAHPAPHLPRGGWIAIDTSEMQEAELNERLHRSYSVVRDSLPKRAQDALDA